MMTYEELGKWIKTLSPEQRKCNAIVLLTDANEFIPLIGTGINESGMDSFSELDENHPYLMIPG